MLRAPSTRPECPAGGAGCSVVEPGEASRSLDATDHLERPIERDPTRTGATASPDARAQAAQARSRRGDRAGGRLEREAVRPLAARTPGTSRRSRPGTAPSARRSTGAPSAAKQRDVERQSACSAIVNARVGVAVVHEQHAGVRAEVARRRAVRRARSRPVSADDNAQALGRRPRRAPRDSPANGATPRRVVASPSGADARRPSSDAPRAPTSTTMPDQPTTHRDDDRDRDAATRDARHRRATA